MGLEEYASDLHGNTVKVNYYNLPDKVFLDANKTKNIIKFSILSVQEKKQLEPGSPDIKVMELTGRTRMITRKELISNFVMIDGSKIKPYVLKNGHEYLAYSMTKAAYKVFKLPENMIGDVNGRLVPSGNYIVYEVDENGNIDRKTMAIINPKSFRKMFRIPNQRIIQEHRLEAPRRGFSVFKKYQKPEYRSKLMDLSSGNRPVQSPIHQQPVQQRAATVPPVQMPQNNMQQPNKFVPNQAMTANKFTPAQMNNRNANQANTNSQGANQNQGSKARYMLLNRVVNLNKQPIGYTVVDKTNGTRTVLDDNKVMLLAGSGNLDKVSLVTNSAGKRYLRGNGIVLEHLPTVIQ